MQGNHDPAQCWNLGMGSFLHLNKVQTTQKTCQFNMIERVAVVILVRHDYPNNAGIPGELYNSQV